MPLLMNSVRRKPSAGQLALHLGAITDEFPPCFRRHRRQQALRSRAQWWFGQMRRKVDEALDFPPAEVAPPDRAKIAQHPTRNGEQSCDGNASMGYESFQI